MTSSDLWTALTSDWPTTLKTVVGAGLGTMLAQWLVPILHEQRKRRSLATYTAMRLAVVLEAYAAACARVIGKNANAETPPGEEWPDWDPRLPDLSDYPDDAEGWRALDAKLASRALDLRNRVSASREVISSTMEYEIDDLGVALDEHLSARGLEAWRIATDLRRGHNIEPADLVWDYVARLQETATSTAAEKAKREEGREKWNARLWQGGEEPNTAT